MYILSVDLRGWIPVSLNPQIDQAYKRHNGEYGTSPL